MEQDIKLTMEKIFDLIEKKEFFKLGQKTTVCLLTLKNWFEVVTSSACIKPEVVQDSEDSELMVKKDIWNWKLPNETLVKMHAVLMVMRAFHNELDNDKAIQKALELGVVSSVNGPLTKRWFLKMIFVAINWRTSNEELIPDIAIEQGIIKSKLWLDEPVKRYHASLMIARALRFSGKIE